MVGVVMLGWMLGTAQAESDVPSNRIVRKVARSFRCDRDEMSLTSVHHEIVGRSQVVGWQVTGCGETFMTATASFRGFVSLASWDRPMRRRAPLDLTCAPESVSYTFIDHVTRLALGCGQQMTYVMADDGQWLVNTAGQRPVFRGVEGSNPSD